MNVAIRGSSARLKCATILTAWLPLEDACLPSEYPNAAIANCATYWPVSDGITLNSFAGIEKISVSCLYSCSCFCFSICSFVFLLLTLASKSGTTVVSAGITCTLKTAATGLGVAGAAPVSRLSESAVSIATTVAAIAGPPEFGATGAVVGALAV